MTFYEHNESQYGLALSNFKMVKKEMWKEMILVIHMIHTCLYSEAKQHMESIFKSVFTKDLAKLTLRVQSDLVRNQYFQ